MERIGKTCSRCNTLQGADCFYVNLRNRDGLTSHCRKCASAVSGEARRRTRLGVTEVERSCVMCEATYVVQRPDRGRHVTTCSEACDRARSNLTSRLGAYGLSREDWDGMVAAAGGCCALCERPTDDLHIDHCHKTGRVRGLLCNGCNSGLGMLGDDAEGLWSAQVYLARSFDLRDLLAA